MPKKPTYKELERMVKEFKKIESERKQTEETLREKTTMLLNILHSANIAVAATDLDFRIIYYNPMAEKFFGYTAAEVIGKTVLEIHTKEKVSPERFENAIEAVRRDGFYSYYVTQETNKSPRYLASHVTSIFDLAGRRVGYSLYSLDITDRQRREEEKAKLEEQLRQAQKMEAIGTLAGGIAHDFNNILGIIVGNTELAINDLSEWNPVLYNLEEVHKASLRAKDMVKQILNFSRQTKPETKPIRLSPLLKESFELIRSSIPTTIEIRQNFSANRDTIFADPTQINQILMNLCTNAAHAMREGGGILEVDLKNIDLDEKQPGKYLILSVSDTGHGMEPELVERIFEPYFTTKQIDEGTGVGLSIVHGIVKNHGGEIHVYSEPGKGTTFNVFFPLIESKTVPESTSLEPLPTGSEHILFVDDEQALADLGKRMLQQLGYAVTMRTSSIDALETFKEQPDKFDLVVTDMTMPNMTGVDLCKELLQIRLDIPIILCTGFSELITEEKAKRLGIKAFLMKPFVLRELAKTIRKMFDQTEQENFECLH